MGIWLNESADGSTYGLWRFQGNTVGDIQDNEATGGSANLTWDNEVGTGLVFGAASGITSIYASDKCIDNLSGSMNDFVRSTYKGGDWFGGVSQGEIIRTVCVFNNVDDNSYVAYGAIYNMGNTDNKRSIDLNNHQGTNIGLCARQFGDLGPAGDYSENRMGGNAAQFASYYGTTWLFSIVEYVNDTGGAVNWYLGRIGTDTSLVDMSAYGANAANLDDVINTSLPTYYPAILGHPQYNRGVEGALSGLRFDLITSAESKSTYDSWYTDFLNGDGVGGGGANGGELIPSRSRSGLGGLGTIHKDGFCGMIQRPTTREVIEMTGGC